MEAVTDPGLPPFVNIAVICACLTIPLLAVVLWSRGLLPGNPVQKLKRGSGAAHFEGRGTHVTDELYLLPGAYKLSYTFEALTRIDLIEAGRGERETLLIKTGTGSLSFTVDLEGRYAFEVEPQGENAAWSLDINPLGLPSQA